MPLYGFHLDVPAPPAVVADRIRVVVGPVPTLWESVTRTFKRMWEPGTPFIGTFDGRSFRMRRNIHYKNSFLPQIRARVAPNQTGSRVNVFMFMPPLSFIFMVIWCVPLALASRTVLDGRHELPPVAALIPLAMLGFGLSLSMRAFFF